MQAHLETGIAIPNMQLGKRSSFLPETLDPVRTDGAKVKPKIDLKRRSARDSKRRLWTWVGSGDSKAEDLSRTVGFSRGI